MSWKWSSLNGPGAETPLSHPLLKLDESPFPIISPLIIENKGCENEGLSLLRPRHCESKLPMGAHCTGVASVYK